MTVIREDREFLDVHFPKAGIDLLRAFDDQRPRPISFGPPKMPGLPPTPQEYSRTCPVGQNVRGFDPRTNRSRGGARNGLVRFLPVQVAGEAFIVQDLNIIVTDGSTSTGPFVQSNFSRAAVASSEAVVSYTGNVTAGNLLVLTVGVYGSIDLSALTVTDTRGNTWITATSLQGGGDSSAILYCIANSSGACTITVQQSSYVSLCCLEYMTFTTLDGQNGNQGSGTPWSSDVIPVTGAADLAIAVFCQGGADRVLTIPGTYNIRVNDQTDIANFEGITVVDLLSVNTATEFTMTADSIGFWASSGASFQ